MKIGNHLDFWGGVMFAVVGLAFTVIAYGVRIGDMVLLPGYAMGTPARMGPAFFPFWLGLILTTIGLVIAFYGMVEKQDKRVDKFHWGPIGYVLGAVVLFGILMKPIGMPLAGIILVMVASLGSHDFHWRPVLILAVALVIFSMLVFVYGLKLPIPLCPDLEFFQELRMCRF